MSDTKTPAPLPEEILAALKPAYANASALKIGKAEAKKLMKPFPDNAIEIRPTDGAIYIPHIFLSQRLNEVFGPGAWALICQDHWEDENCRTVYGEHVLIVRGCFVGSAMGERNHFNAGEDRYSDALETTAAESLRRITGKRLSVGNQVWQPGFIEKWKKKFVETYQGEDGGMYWRRKGSGVAEAEFGRPAGKGESTLKAAGMKKLLSKDEADEARHIMLQILCASFGRDKLTNYAVTKKIIPAGASLEDWPADQLASEEWAIKKLTGEIEAFMAGNAPKVGWQEFKIPFKTAKGKTIGDLNKRDIKAFLKEVPADKYPDFVNALDEASKHWQRRG